MYNDLKGVILNTEGRIPATSGMTKQKLELSQIERLLVLMS
jgi:hypothetical protein